MASLTMTTASLFGNANTTQRPATARRSLVMTRAAVPETQEATLNGDDKGSNGRRAVMFAVTAAAICAVGFGKEMAMAEEELKRGSPEAKKKYAAVCVTMPTARICKY